MACRLHALGKAGVAQKPRGLFGAIGVIVLAIVAYSIVSLTGDAVPQKPPARRVTLLRARRVRGPFPARTRSS